MKYYIKIDPKTIKSNCRISQICHLQFGIDQNNKRYRDAKTNKHCRPIFPLPEWEYSYLDTNVTCQYCNQEFSYRDLKAKDNYGLDPDVDNPKFWDNTVCPRCDAFDCCTLEFQTLDQLSVQNSWWRNIFSHYSRLANHRVRRKS